MSNTVKLPCPLCSREMRTKPGKLSQAGHTYLPAVISECDECDYRRFDRTGEPWAVEIPVAPRTK